VWYSVSSDISCFIVCESEGADDSARPRTISQGFTHDLQGFQRAFTALVASLSLDRFGLTLRFRPLDVVECVKVC
jgi:hypothetical protein